MVGASWSPVDAHSPEGISAKTPQLAMPMSMTVRQAPGGKEGGRSVRLRYCASEEGRLFYGCFTVVFWTP